MIQTKLNHIISGTLTIVVTLIHPSVFMDTEYISNKLSNRVKNMRGYSDTSPQKVKKFNLKYP